MSNGSIEAAGSSHSKGVGSKTPQKANVFDREQWLHKQWEQGKTIWTVPHAGGGYIH